MFFLLKWCIFKWQVLFVILKGNVRRTHMQMLISRKTVGPFIVSKGPPMRMVWGSQGPSKSRYKWKPCLYENTLPVQTTINQSKITATFHQDCQTKTLIVYYDNALSLSWLKRYVYCCHLLINYKICHCLPPGGNYYSNVTDRPTHHRATFPADQYRQLGINIHKPRCDCLLVFSIYGHDVVTVNVIVNTQRLVIGFPRL